MNRILALSIDILDFIKTNGSVSASQLQEHFHAAPSTIYNIMQTLEKKHMIERYQHRNSLYQIGAKAFAIGSAYAPDLLSTMNPYLQQIASNLKLTAVLGIEQECQVLFIGKVSPAKTSGFISSAQIGGTEEMHCTSLGKALLSQLSMAELEEKLGGSQLEKKTQYTHDSIEDLWKNISDSCSDGFFIDNEEHAVGKICISVPLLNPAGDIIAAVSVSGVKAQFPDFAEIGAQIIKILQDCIYRQIN